MLLIHSGASATGNASLGTGIQIVGDHEVTGEATSGKFCGSASAYTVYFVAQFSQPFSSGGTWKATQVRPGKQQASGNNVGAYLNFDTTRNPVILVKVGLSFVSVENARMNLAQE